MKTLNEVIAVFEKACDLERRCKDCIGCLAQENGCPNDGAESIPDALHYLKEYKAKQEDLEQKNDHVCEMAKTICEQYDRLCNRLAEEYRNEPLTWDELKSMEGKPVFVEKCQDDEPKGWLLILRSNHDVVTCTTKHGNSFYLYRSLYGEKWQAYRKERE